MKKGEFIIEFKLKDENYIPKQFLDMSWNWISFKTVNEAEIYISNLDIEILNNTETRITLLT